MVRLSSEELAEFAALYDVILGKFRSGENVYSRGVPTEHCVSRQHHHGASFREGDFLLEGLGVAVIRGQDEAYVHARLLCDLHLPDHRIYWVDGSAHVHGDESHACVAAAVVEPATGREIAHVQILHPHPLVQVPRAKRGELPFTAECASFCLAAENALACKKAVPPPDWDLLVVFSDSWQAIEFGLCGFKKAESQGYPWEKYIERTHECLRELRELGVSFQAHLVPGHCGVPGNASADRLARKMARTWNTL